ILSKPVDDFAVLGHCAVAPHPNSHEGKRLSTMGERRGYANALLRTSPSRFANAVGSVSVSPSVMRAWSSSSHEASATASPLPLDSAFASAAMTGWLPLI